ncbi:hypothetical protein DaDZ19_21420 [Dickeya ananatis]
MYKFNHPFFFEFTGKLSFKIDPRRMIVAHPKGSILNQIRAEMIDMAHLYKNHHSALATIVIRGDQSRRARW